MPQLSRDVRRCDLAPDAAGRAARECAARGARTRTRDPDGTEEFFTGLDLVGPGAVQARAWRADGAGTALLREAGIARRAGVVRTPS
ncbi:SAM-dependent methyltransferase [Streptomyces sp. NPDC007808]|uniref:SAM-dependent methyltransferase n=1 Tax=Streptomyces sp. NPDC007808 TaxID=3364779 RepID=UPI00369FB28E